MADKEGNLKTGTETEEVVNIRLVIQFNKKLQSSKRQEEDSAKGGVLERVREASSKPELPSLAL